MSGTLVTAMAALIAALIGSVLGPLIRSWWIEPRATANQKMLDSFQVFLTNIEGFYQGSLDEEKIREVCLQYRMTWLYTSDEVIIAINDCFKAQGAKEPTEGLAKTTTYMVLAMRKEVYPQTTLQAENYLTPFPTRN